MTTSQPHLSHPKYRPDIDGLRAIAVLSVIAFHAFPEWLKGGFIGVDIFFVISGYLISSIIFANLDSGTFNFAEFYARRVKRIFPALILVLAASYAFGWFALISEEYKQLGKHIAGGAGFASNLVLWSEAGYFDNSAETKPLLHLWSLGIEEQFYIVWPLMLWLAWKRKFNLLTISVLVAAVSFYLNVKGVKKDGIAAFYSPQTRFWELLCGSMLAWATLYEKGAFVEFRGRLDRWLARVIYRERQEADGRTLANFLSLLGLLVLAYASWRIHKGLSFPGKWAALPVLGAVLIILAGQKAWANHTILSSKVAVWFGLISYPLYLWHWPLLSFARIVGIEEISIATRMAAVLLSVLLAWLTYRLVERPLRLGGRTRQKVVGLVVPMAIVGYIGYSTYVQDGFGFRHESNLAMDEAQIQEERGKYWADDAEKNFSAASRKLLVYGDSQAFDIYKALRNDDRFGIKMFHVGTGCTSFNLPKRGAPADISEYCQNEAHKFLTSPEIRVANTIVYSIFWAKDAEPQGAFENYKDVITRIRSANPEARIIFFGPKPLLGKAWRSINSITKGGRSVLGMNDFLNKVMWKRDVDNDYVRKLSAELGVGFVDVDEVYCLNGCDFYVDGMFTHFDQTHWTEFGARLFLDKLNRSDAYKSQIAQWSGIQ